MKTLIQYLLILHITAGGCSLILFWIPVFARKRKGLHTIVGRWYVYLMWVVVITAGLMSIHNYFIGEINKAFFLGFLSLITGTPLWYAIRIMKSKQGYTTNLIRQFTLINAIVVVFGLFLFCYGLFYVTTGVRYLMIFFGVLGILNIQELLKVRHMRSTRPDWYKLHYTGILTSGIAAYTAFLVFGGQSLFKGLLSDQWEFIPWILPTVIGIAAIRLMDRKRKMQKKVV